MTDRYTGQRLQGATVVIDERVLSTGPDGSVTVNLPSESQSVTIQSPGYEAITTSLVRGGPAEWQVALRPTVLRGQVFDADASSGIVGAEVAVVAPDGTEQHTTTDKDGRFAFEAVPDGAAVRISSADHGVAEEVIGERTEIDLEMRPSFVSGKVTDATGSPLAGARVTAVNGSAEGFTGPDGTFHLTGGSDIGEVLISAPGFADQTIAIGETRSVTAALEGEMIKAVYANLGVLSDPERWNRLI